MVKVNIYRDIDKDNEHIGYKLTNRCYKAIRGQLMANYTILAYTDNGDLTGDLIDDNI